MLYIQHWYTFLYVRAILIFWKLFHKTLMNFKNSVTFIVEHFFLVWLTTYSIFILKKYYWNKKYHRSMNWFWTLKLILFWLWRLVDMKVGTVKEQDEVVHAETPKRWVARMRKRTATTLSRGGGGPKLNKFKLESK